jgi:hypothetical protein
MAHLRLDLLFGPRPSAPPPPPRPPASPEGVLQPPALEGRVDDPPLPRPCLAIGQEDRPPQQRRNPSPTRSDFGKSSGRSFSTFRYKIGLVDQEGPEERRAELRHPGAIKPLGLGREDIAPEQPHVAPERHIAPPRGGFRRQIAARRRHAASPCTRDRLSRSGWPRACAPGKARGSVRGPAVTAKIVIGARPGRSKALRYWKCRSKNRQRSAFPAPPATGSAETPPTGPAANASRPRDARDRHRIAQREGAAIAGRRDVDPGDRRSADISARSPAAGLHAAGS